MSAVQLSLALQPHEPPPPAGALAVLGEMHQLGALANLLDPSKLHSTDRHLLFATRVYFEERKTLTAAQCAFLRRVARVGA